MSLNVCTSSMPVDAFIRSGYSPMPCLYPLVVFVSRVLEFGPDQGLQGQVVDIVRMLLDPDSMDQSPEKDPFLELFYDKYVGELINLLIEGADQNQQQSQEELDAFRRQEEVCIPSYLRLCRYQDLHAVARPALGFVLIQ